MAQWLRDGREQGEISKSILIEIQTAAVSGFFHQFAKMIYLEDLDTKDDTWQISSCSISFGFIGVLGHPYG